MKRVIIVGGTSGIGRALAEIYSEVGFAVGITGRRENLLKEFCDKGKNRFFEVTDICDTGTLPEKLTNLAVAMGGVDILIISSGVGELNPMLAYDIEAISIDTNVSGFTAVADWSYNYFATCKKGHIVVISSLGSLRGDNIAPAYNASKAYQSNYADGLRKKAVKSGIPVYVTEIKPGFVDTQMAKGSGLFWIMPVDKVARQIFNAVRRKRKVAIVTRRWTIVAFLLKSLPDFLYYKI
ncbi:MAG: SDR family NAD(P)-dependent oxidoreductase [Bacteroidales bacterium]